MLQIWTYFRQIVNKRQIHTHSVSQTKEKCIAIKRNEEVRSWETYLQKSKLLLVDLLTRMQVA